MKLDAAATRLLRSATDMSFTSAKAEHYFTSLPVPGGEFHAFARTWRGPDWLRAGAVWSHVLLLDATALRDIDDLTSLQSLFRMPTSNSAAELEKDIKGYEASLVLSTSTKASHRLDFSDSMGSRALATAYSTGTTLSGDGNSNEELILAIQSQQWPALRNSFAARTRSRTSDSPWHIDLEIVERFNDDRPSDDSIPPWLQPLATDLFAKGSSLKDFLWKYGETADSTIAALPALTEVHSLLTNGAAPETVVSRLASAFPLRGQMSSLKRDLLGPVSEHVALWRVSEVQRLWLVFFAGEAADYRDLEVGARLLRAAASSEGGLNWTEALPFERIDGKQLQSLVSDIADHSTLSNALNFALADPDLGSLIVARRPEILADPRIWSEVDSELLLRSYDSVEEVARSEILESLVDHRAVEPLTVICERDRSAWWALLYSAAAAEGGLHATIERASTLREVVRRFGAAAIDPPSRIPNSNHEALMILLSADLSAGLWRRCPPDRWLRLLRDNDLPRSAPAEGFVLDRANVVALLASTASASARMRTQGWTTTFEYLHSRLADPQFDGEAWAALANALPQGPEWDRCLRLRRGVVAEMKRSQWSASDIGRVRTASRPHEREIDLALQPPAPRKGILQSLWEQLTK